MQTFLPFPDFEKSARVLDRQRLGKQRVEAMQVYDALRGHNDSGKLIYAWRNHPCTKMWLGYENALLVYRNAMLVEWERRGYKNIKMQPVPVFGTVEFPPWFGNKQFHSSHRAALLLKNRNWYSQFNWRETPSYNYLWPETK
jgi:hypothetical protein